MSLSDATATPRGRTPRGTGGLLPQPLLSVILLGIWVLAFNRFTPGVLAGGVLVALLVPMGTARFWPEYPRIARPLAAVRFLGVFLWDVMVANVRVARLVLGPTRALRPAFFAVPVDCDDPYVMALLAAVISLTPGTVSSDWDPATRRLLVHGLDVGDPAAEAAHIKARYERPLREIFAC